MHSHSGWCGCISISRCSEGSLFYQKLVPRSGTSIGANIEEAIGGQSGKDFVGKMGIAYKEARERHYWLRLLRDAGYLDESESNSIITDCEELLKLITSILKTMKRNSDC